MAIKTQSVQFNYKLALPAGLQLSSDQRLIVPPSTRNNLNSPVPLKGRVKTFFEFFSSIGAKELEPLIEMLLKPVESLGEAPYLTSGATCTGDSLADISYFIRTFMSDPVMPDSVSQQATGVTTGENAFRGAWAAFKAALRFKAAKEIDDTGGMIEGGMDVARGIGQSIGGAAYLGYRGVAITADICNLDASINATTPIGKSAFALGTIGNVFFAVFYLMLAVWSSYGLKKDWQFSVGMKAHQSTDNKLFKFLMQKVQADPKEKLKKLKGYWKTLPPERHFAQFHDFKAKLSQTALDALADQFVGLQKASLKGDKKPFTKAETKAVLTMLFASKDSELRKGNAYANYLSSLGLSQEDGAEFDFSMLDLIGFRLEEAKRQSRKDAKFSRMANDTCVAAVKKAASRGLSERLSADDSLIKASAQKEISELKGKVKTANTTNQLLHTALLISGIIGVVVSVLSFFAFPPAGTIAVMVLTLLLCVAMMAADGYCMTQGWDDGMPGRYDKKYIVAISLMLLAAFGVSLGVTLGFGLPLIPLIGVFVIQGMGLTLSGVAYVKLDHKEKKWIENHPTLSLFRQHLNAEIFLSGDTALDEKTTALFKKLPKAQRIAVHEQYFAMNSRGELGFKTEKYRALDAAHDFGIYYLFDQLTPKRMGDAKEYQLFIRGVRKTLKFFWKKWEEAKTEENKQVALQMQAFFERVIRRDREGIDQMLHSALMTPEVFSQLEKDLWYVAKRQESIVDFKKAVDAII